MGAHAFAIYVLDEKGKQAVVIAQENLDTDELEPIDVGEGPVGVALLTGVAKVPDDIASGTVKQPFAVVPLMVGDRAIGAISIVTMLEQKTRWATVDGELFKLLGEHAGLALVAANLFAGAQGAVSALGDLEDNLKKRGASLMPAAEGE
jgi:GAF domain-containing protein